jgi:hypothetical protein
MKKLLYVLLLSISFTATAKISNKDMKECNTLRDGSARIMVVRQSGLYNIQQMHQIVDEWTVDIDPSYQQSNRDFWKDIANLAYDHPMKITNAAKDREVREFSDVYYNRCISLLSQEK